MIVADTTGFATAGARMNLPLLCSLVRPGRDVRLLRSDMHHALDPSSRILDTYARHAPASPSYKTRVTCLHRHHGLEQGLGRWHQNK